VWVGFQPHFVRNTGCHWHSRNHGAAAHKAQVGDLLIIASYASYSEVEVKNYAPTLCYVDANNVLTQIKATL
jgi:aspartate 1-decarboxylase